MSDEYNCPPVCPECRRAHRGACQPSAGPDCAVATGSAFLSSNMNDIQNEIDRRRRECLTLQLAACALYNQIHGAPMPRAKEAQEKLLMDASTEAQHMQEEIDRLIRVRDRKG